MQSSKLCKHQPRNNQELRLADRGFQRLDRLDFVIAAACGFLLIVASIRMIENPFGFFGGVPIENAGTATIHNLTIFLLSLNFLFFWWLLRNVDSFLCRVLLTVAFVMIEYTIYDSIWGFVFLSTLGEIKTPYFTLSPNNMNFDLTILSFIFWWAVPSIILLTIKAWERKYIPKIRFKRVFLVILLNLCLILWLWSTNFFQDYLLYTSIQQMEITTYDPNLISYLTSVTDPHNLVWAVGKLFGMISFWLVFIPFSRKGEAQRESVEKTDQKKYAPWWKHHHKKNRKS
jgi:hypothetical protein